MRIKYKDNHEYYMACSYNSKDNYFELKGSEQSTILYYPRLQLDNQYDFSKFSFVLLANESPTCSENSIYQVFIGENRIGWIFPFQALLSNNHDQANNPYFLKYAYVATELLLQAIEETDVREEPGEIYLEDYYNPELNVLVLDSENTAQIREFNLEKYVVGLFKHGYSFSGKGNILADVPTDGSRKRIKIKAVSEELSGVPNINYLFKEQLPFADNEVIRFYLCYQVIELLITIVFEDQFRKLLAEISVSAEKLFDHRETLSKLAGEKYRINELFTKYVELTETRDKTDLNAACEKLLTESGKDVAGSYYENLYAVRCLVVHKLYSLSTESIKMLADINKPFLNIIMDMLFTFKKECP